MIPIYICGDGKNILAALKTTINNSVIVQDYDMKMVGATTDPIGLLAFCHVKANVY